MATAIKHCEADVSTNRLGSTNRLETALNNIPLGIVIFDRDFTVAFWNDRYLEMFGLAPNEIAVGTKINDLGVALLTKKQGTANFGLTTQNIDGTTAEAGPNRQRLADGRLISHTVCGLPDGGGMVTFEDMTEREKLNNRLKEQDGLEKAQDEKLRVKNFQFDTAINNMSQGLCFFDGARRLIVCNDRYIDMYDLSRDRIAPGITLEEIVDMRFEAGSFPAMSRDEYLVWRDNIAVSAKPTDGIVELRNGRTFQIRHRPMPDAGWVATHEDITEQRQAEAKIARMARHDALTDLANRILMHERLEHALTHLDHDKMVAVHHLDLDQFKVVNDTLGHPAGDQLLKLVADRLRQFIGEGHTIARTGGDEFVFVQAIKDPAEAADLAQCIIESLSKPYDIDGNQAVIGASIGIAIGPSDGVKPDHLLRHADLALYRAKSDGRRTFRFFEPDMNLQMQNRRAMEHDMRAALNAGEFELYYQPVVNLADNAISGFEALIRWNHPENGLVAPNAFIPLAEEIGFIVPLGEWIIKDACATAARWPDKLSVAVNVSAIQFRSPGLMQVIVNALASSGLHPTRLELEITESVLLQDKSATLATLHQLRSLGVRIAMDDFGTGYSSLTYLQSFPFDKIKIDRSFVKDITDNAGSLNIVRAIAALAHGMGMVATAEGVETQEQLDTITSEGCTEMQGFLFGQPLPASDIERLYLLMPDKQLAPAAIIAA